MRFVPAATLALSLLSGLARADTAPLEQRALAGEPLTASCFAADTNSVCARAVTLAPLPAGWRVARGHDTCAVAGGTNPAPLSVLFRGRLAMLFGESTAASGRFRAFVDDRPVTAPADLASAADPLLFDAAAAARRAGAAVPFAVRLATGLTPTNHVLRLEPVLDPAAAQELRLESLGVAGPPARVWMNGPYGNPARYATSIAAFEAQDRNQPPPRGAIVATGSSSMRGWHGRIRDDLAPLTVLPRGFGGSNYNDLLQYAERVILAYEPRAVLIYEGDNDIAAGASAELVAATFRQLVAVLHARQPALRVYVLAVKPSRSRWAKWPETQRANALLMAACAGDPRLTFIDVATPLLGPDGEPREALFKSDRLHLLPAGYDVWRDVVRPVLLAGEGSYEQP